MMVPVPPVYRKRRGKVRAAAPAVVTALTLVSATYEEGSWFTLTFDRAIDASGLNPAAFVLIDGSGTGTRYVGTEGFTQPTAESVEISLQAAGSASGPDVVLDAAADSGIVAADDGDVWAGVTDLVLPFP